MANEALRVIAVGYKRLDNLSERKHSENDITFLGLIGMIDPPKEGVKEAVQICKKAGIKTVMITGDHIATAKAIAKDLGILTAGDKAITTPASNALLGEYFRNRLGLANGAFVTKADFDRYGRSDVTFYKLDDEQFYMDFSV